MRLILDPPHRPRAGRCGQVLVEVLLASSVSVMALGGLLALVIEVAKDQRRSIADAALTQAAGLLQDRISRLLRSMSASESVAFTDQVSTGSSFYRHIVVAQGASPTWPREELIYNPSTLTLTYDPNRATTGGEVALFNSASTAKLRDLYFFASLKNDDSPDSSSLNVWMKFDDNGESGRKNPGGTTKTNVIYRTFTVKMRNN